MYKRQTFGGGLRTAELTLPGFHHDICSAIPPLPFASPFFRAWPLQQHGVEFVHAPIAAAHPFDNGTSAVLTRHLEETAALLGSDETTYKQLIQPFKQQWDRLIPAILGPFLFPETPIELAQIGLSALQPATWLAKKFRTPAAQALWA